METRKLKRVALVCASELTIKAFLLEHIKTLAQHYDLSVIANSNDTQLLRRLGIAVEVLPAPIPRDISPLRDLRALFKLYSLFRTEKFDLVHSVTPKAGLLAMLAGFLARVPIRLHTFTGQVWVTRRGPMRTLLKAADRVIARLATHVFVDSFSQCDFLVAQGILDERNATVLGHGSISGVDTARFRPDPAARQRLRLSLGMDEADAVFLYLGRLKRDKGVLDLARAFAACGARHGSARLLLVGPDEERLDAEIRRLAGNCAARLHCVGHTDRPQDYYAAADVFCLPSYREGFGTAVIEAAATGLPAIGSRIYGVTDAIIERQTGLLFEAGNAGELAGKMDSLIDNIGLRHSMGEQARVRALRDFPAVALSARLLEFYDRLLQGRASP